MNIFFNMSINGLYLVVQCPCKWILGNQCIQAIYSSQTNSDRSTAVPQISIVVFPTKHTQVALFADVKICIFIYLKLLRAMFRGIYRKLGRLERGRQTKMERGLSIRCLLVTQGPGMWIGRLRLKSWWMGTTLLSSKNFIHFLCAAIFRCIVQVIKYSIFNEICSHFESVTRVGIFGRGKN